ncbi:hypothetical protein [Streptomyces sp. NPDC058695]|uniref:hypothetical protein n=1 Tax=Streptomyces sp. NPDC058695 TaxID=3346604 RepID=UPI003661F7E4
MPRTRSAVRPVTRPAGWPGAVTGREREVLWRHRSQALAQLGAHDELEAAIQQLNQHRRTPRRASAKHRYLRPRPGSFLLG